MGILYHLLKLQTALSYNKLIYGLQKIPLLGRIVSDKLYKAEGFQTIMTLLGVLQQVFKQILGKGVYFFLIYLVTDWLSGLGDFVGLRQGDFFLTLLVALSLGYGSIIKNFSILSPDQVDVLCIKIYKISPKTYYKLEFFYDDVLAGFFYMVGLGLALFFLDLSPLGALYFTLLNLGVRLCIRYFLCSHLYKKTNLNLNDYGANWIFWGLLSPISLFLIQMGISWQGDFSLAKVFFTPWVGLLGLGLSLGFYYKIFKSNLLIKVTTKTLSAKMAKNEDELDAVKLTMDLENKDLVMDLDPNIKKLNGVAFINQVFYARLSRIFYKMVRTRVLIVGIGSLLLLGLAYYFKEDLTPSPDKVGDMNQTLMQIVPSIILYISSLIYVSDYLAKLSFYHLDRTLMGDPLYRSPKMVIYSLKVRLKKALRLNFLPLLILMALTLGLKVLIPQLSWTLVAFLMFWEVLCMFFFSLYHLYVYYMIQPYDVGMKVKSPIYQILNAVFLFLSYQSIQIFVHIENPLPYYIGLGGILLVFLIAGYFLVQVLAPKNFKLRR